MVEWSELSPAWQAGLQEAWVACCAGSLPIGAVITGPEEQIMAKGRNRLFETSAEPPYLTGRLAHAEMNAIRAFELTGHLFVESTLFTTLEPCPMCLGAIRLTRFESVHFAAHDVLAGSAVLLQATDFMRRKAPRMVGPFSSELEILLLALLTETVLRRGHPQGLKNLSTREERNPGAVQLGYEWHQSGIIGSLIAGQASASEFLAAVRLA